MKTEEYEAKLAALEETVDKLVKKDKKSARTIKKLEKRMTTAEDIEAVIKLMRAYGF